MNDASGASWHLAEGDALTPELTVTRLLGGGSAFEAYLAFDEITYGPVVAKVVRPHLVSDEATLAGLDREVGVLGALNHPVVVRGLRAVVGGPRPHVVMEALDGPRLSSLVRRHGPLPAQQYLPLAIELASALAYLRHVGVVHLDLKPGNVIMGAPARLIDLSVARPLAEAEALGHPVGTDAYMAPEQCAPQQAGRPGHASDVFGLGVTLYQAITGELPFDRGDPEATDLAAQYPQLVDAAYPLPTGGVDPAVAAVVLACLAADPADRPDARAVAEAVGPALDRTPRGQLAGPVKLSR